MADLSPPRCVRPSALAGPAAGPLPPARRAPPDPFAELNPQQRAAVMHGDAPLLVLAGAGSGKTLTLAARVARLVLDGADPTACCCSPSRAAPRKP